MIDLILFVGITSVFLCLIVFNFCSIKSDKELIWDHFKRPYSPIDSIIPLNESKFTDNEMLKNVKQNQGCSKYVLIDKYGPAVKFSLYKLTFEDGSEREVITENSVLFFFKSKVHLCSIK